MTSETADPLPTLDRFTVPLAATGPLVVALDGQVVWSFDAARDGSRSRSGYDVPWPPALFPHLTGVARVTVSGFADGTVHLDEEVRFDDRDVRAEVRDRHGHPLMVNKVGTLARALDHAPDGVRRELLEGSLRIVEVLRDTGRAEAFLSYGALLGALRTGRMIGHDCDVDLAYLSAHDQPVDVILESYRLERVVRDAGWSTMRMSGADFKVRLPLSDGRTEMVDVFAAFHVSDRFYNLGNHSGALSRDDVVPTGSVVLEGVRFPAPRRPEAMMEFLYGAGWRVPDPAFRYQDPPEGVRRLDGWLRGFRSQQPAWNRLYRSPLGASLAETGSDFARWVRPRLEPEAPVADLGCGNGRDSRFFAESGHAVRSFDFSTDARVAARRLLRRHGQTPDVRLLQLDELRTVLAEGILLRDWTLYARGLLGCLDQDARRNLWRMAGLAGGAVFLELAVGRGPEPAPPGLVGRVDLVGLLEDVERAGGRVVTRWEGPGGDLLDRTDPSTARLHLDFSGRNP